MVTIEQPIDEKNDSGKGKKSTSTSSEKPTATKQPMQQTTPKTTSSSSSTPPSLFWSDTTGGLTPAGFILVVIGIPLLILRKYLYVGGITFILSISIALLQENNNNAFLPPSEKLEIRYNILSAEDLMAELEALENTDEDGDDKGGGNNTPDMDERRLKYLEGLSALAKKYGRRNSTENPPKDLALWCQQIAFVALKGYGSDDPHIVAGAVSLLALIAKDPRVRKRYTYQTDEYGLEIPIQSLQSIFSQAKQTEDEEQELYLAEVLRKGCLFLGAVVNNDNDSTTEKRLNLSMMIVQDHNGLDLILSILNWFRCHEEVCNWALWSIFTMAFDRMEIKRILVQSGGIPTICQALKENPTSLEVNRHGIALLFDLLRETSSQDIIPKYDQWDPWEVRKMALNSGLHKITKSAMLEFSESMDIMMMGQEILIGTAYQGDIPVYQQSGM